jgi:preprotein translocase SecE subunit
LYQDNSEGPKAARWLAVSRKFLADVRREMKDISWPAWREVSSTTITVVFFVLVIGAYVYVVDRICYRLIEQMLLHRR